MDKTEMQVKAAAAKLWLEARQATRREAEAKVLTALNILRDVRDALKKDAKASDQEQSDLDSYFRSVMRYVESQTDSPEQDATLSAMEDVACYGSSVMDTYNMDATLSMVEKSIGWVDECSFGHFDRSEKSSLEKLDTALMGLPSVK